MVDYICLAEFDIDKGSGVRLQYPESVPGISAEDLAEYMITEGAHNFGVVSTYFTVGRRPCKELLSEQSRMISSPQNVFLDKIFSHERKQRLMENYWLSEDHHFVPGQIQPQPTRALPNSMRNQTASSNEITQQAALSYSAQKVRLYRVENNQWKPYFQQSPDRLVEFQLTVHNNQNFTIKLIADPQDSHSPLVSQSIEKLKASTFSQAAAAQSHNPFCIEVKVHPFLNFKALQNQPHRASFQNIHGYIYGIEIVNEDIDSRLNLHQMMTDGLDFDPYQCFEYLLNQNSQTLFFFNILKNRQDQNVKRGAVYKALAFGCRNKVLLEPFSQLIQVTLDSIIDVTDLTASADDNLAKYHQIIAQVFTQVNKVADRLLVDRGNFIQRAVSLDYNTNVAWKASNQNGNAILSGKPSKDSLYQIQDVTIDNEPIMRVQTQITLPLATPPDQVTSSSLIRFINHFGKQTMVIYDAILADKRIIFAGSRNLSITQIQNYLFAVASMVSVPLYGIQNKILPYVPLSKLDTLIGDEGFLAGVTNPMFMQNRKCYDVGIQIDESKLNADSSYVREPYFEHDMQFIKTLLVRIRTEKLNDDEVRQAFQSYTMLMLDMATNLSSSNSQDSVGMTHNLVPLSQKFLNRTRRLKNTHLFKTHISMQKMMDLDMTHGISLANVKAHMRTLRIKGVPSGPLSEIDANNIFKELDVYVQDEMSAIKLLYMAPLCRQGIGLLAHGLFYDDERVQVLTARLLVKLQRSCKAGELAVNRLSEFFKMRMQDILNETQDPSQLAISIRL